MKKAPAEIKKELSEVENVLFRCNQKAVVLKILNNYAARGEGFSHIADDDDISALYGGMSVILEEIVEDVSNAISLVGGLQNIEILKSLKEVPA
ncbi:MAG: hypothetical protein PHQ63_04895 [Smithellaceae bacterium]|nr:hypothetical protein [Smithellaceae bacterium]